MCGRFVSLTSLDVLTSQLRIDVVATDPLPPRYNVAPSMEIYAVITRDGQRRLGTLRWGFVPPWAKRVGEPRQPINARLETVATSRMFAKSFASRRCLLPTDGFYEWQERTDGPKQPYHLAYPDGRPVVMAGIWTTWRDPEALDAEPVGSTAIVTTVAQGPMAELHHRMPVVLPEDHWEEWLTAPPEDANHLHEVVTALEAPQLQATAVSRRVNDVRNDGPELLTPA